jgi:hypothetical protein
VSLILNATSQTTQNVILNATPQTARHVVLNEVKDLLLTCVCHAPA